MKLNEKPFATLKILVVDDDHAYWQGAFRDVLQKAGAQVKVVDNRGDAVNKIKQDAFDAIILDLNLGSGPEEGGLFVLKETEKMVDRPPIIVATVLDKADPAVRAMQFGAWNLLVKKTVGGWDDLLVTEVRKAVEETKRAKQIVELTEECKRLRGREHGKIVGAESGLRAVMERVELVAKSDTTVLVRGESGTGKELVATAIHGASPRSMEVLVKVNCAALNENLLESELFGHVKGAFTGAVGNRIGRLEEAEGGTLFLDEIGDFSPTLQVKLLRVLQDREYERVGDNRTLKANVRIIAATNQDLETRLNDKLFRYDLYYRIQRLPHLPAAAARPDRRHPRWPSTLPNCAATRIGLRRQMPTPRDNELLVAYDWPGNVRELASVMERAAILGKGCCLEVAKALGMDAAPPKYTHTGEAVRGVTFLRLIHRNE